MQVSRFFEAMRLLCVIFIASQCSGCASHEATRHRERKRCVCQSSWGYPADYDGGMCTGPLIGCPSTACDGDSGGPWCVVTDKNCDGAQEFKEKSWKQAEYFAYCTPDLPSGPKLAADDTRVRYIGRFDMGKPKAPRFSWPMTGVSASIHGGSSIYGSFAFPEGGGRLRVVVDGVTAGFVQQGGHSKMKSLLLADNLDSSSSHLVEVFKVGEDGAMTFGGFQLDSGGFNAAPQSASRRMEFIGDSDTAGWCADGNPVDDFDEDGTQDAYVTWAQQIARAVKAEARVEAVSGWGVTKQSTPIQTVLNYAVKNKPKVEWNYSQWTPDAVVLLIGPNDESYKMTKTLQQQGGNVTGGGASDSTLGGQSFINSYLGLLNMVVTNYKGAKTPPKIIHVCGGSMNGFDPCSDIQTANDKFNAAQSQAGSGFKGFYTAMKKKNWRMINADDGKSAYNGCEGHYNEKGHHVVAMDILPQIQSIMGWENGSHAPTLDSVLV